MRSACVVITILISCFYTSAQDGFEDLDFKLGVKTSINLSSLTGTELSNARPKFGYTAGAYAVFPVGKSNWFIQPEALVSFRGSNFKHNEPGSSVYSRITTFYVDFNPLLGYQLNAEDDKNQVLWGPYLGAHILSSAFINSSKVPFINGLPIKPLDVGGALYYQIKSTPVSFQFGVKMGLVNINDGIYFEDVKPDTGTGGTVKNLSFEIGMLF